MLKNISPTICFLIILITSGCATKWYHSPAIQFAVKDAVSHQVVRGAELVIGAPLDEVILAVSNNEGEISLKAEYDIKTHFYPFPIPSRGMAMPALFSLRHMEYGNYDVECLFMTMGNGKCAPVFKESLKVKKPLIFECESCCTYTSIRGNVKTINAGDTDTYEFIIKKEFKNNISSEYHTILLPTLNSDQVNKVKSGDEFHINILTNGSCREILLPYDSDGF